MEANKSPLPSCGAGAPSGSLTCPGGGGGGGGGAAGAANRRICGFNLQCVHRGAKFLRVSSFENFAVKSIILFALLVAI